MAYVYAKYPEMTVKSITHDKVDALRACGQAGRPLRREAARRALKQVE